MSRTISFTLNVSAFDEVMRAAFFASLNAALVATGSAGYDTSSAPFYYRECPITVSEIAATQEFVVAVDGVDKTGIGGVGLEIARNYVHWS